MCYVYKKTGTCRILWEGMGKCATYARLVCETCVCETCVCVKTCRVGCVWYVRRVLYATRTPPPAGSARTWREI